MKNGIYAVAPIAVLGSACVLRPFTPSVSVAFWAQDVPPSTPRLLPTATDAIASWQLPPENPWARWSKFTLLASLEEVQLSADVPDVRQLEVVRSAECAGGRLAVAGIPPNTMLVSDLRGAASVALAASLSVQSRQPVAPVLTFNNWPGQDEMIPAEETLSALVSMRPRLPAGGQAGTIPLFLLDAWRLAYRFDHVDDGTTDNRYMLSTADLPDAASLRAQGITQVMYIVESLHDTEMEEDDLYDTFAAYQDAGIQMTMVDLPYLCGLGSPPANWSVELHHHFYRLHRRVPLMHQPDFYVHAQGGFGGAHAGPSPWRSGGHFGFGGGGG